MENSSCSNGTKQALLLGMAFHDRDKSENPKRGQGFRDRIRLEALEAMNYAVRTLDDKHQVSVSSQNKHCKANFADARRMKVSMDELWGRDNNSYDHIILDYFFSPVSLEHGQSYTKTSLFDILMFSYQVGWARTRWTDNFYKETMPLLASAGYLNMHGKIWLPNLECVRDCLTEFKDELNPYFVQSLVPVSEAASNPLYQATEKVEDDLLKCPDKLNNLNQIEPILKNSDDLFICLTYDPVAASPKGSQSEKESKAKAGIKRRRLHEQDFSQ
jgi:hypothetical protein